MPKCDRCGSTENVQRSLVVDMPAKCLKCIEEEREADDLQDSRSFLRAMIRNMGNR